MAELPEDTKSKPTNRPGKPPAGADGSPKFWRLLIVLVLTVILLGFLTWATEAFYS